MQRHLAALLVIGNHTGRTVDVLEFQQSRMYPAVRIYQSIHAEISVVGIFAVIAAVSVHLSSVNCLAHIDRVIAPLPNKSAADAVVLLDHMEVIFQISGPVAHRMAKLAHDERFSSVFLLILMNLLKGRIHPAEEIDIVEIVFPFVRGVQRALVMGQAGIIKLLRPLQRRLERTAISALISHGPDHNAGTVFVPLHAAAGTVHRRLRESRIVCDRLIPVSARIFPAGVFHVPHHCPVAFIIRFIDDVKSHRVIQFVKMRRVGVMAGTDRIDIVLFHQRQVFHDLLLADRKSGDRIAVMAVRSVKFDVLSVDADHISFHMDLTDSHVIGDDLMGRLINDRVEIWLLGIPQMRSRDLQMDMIPLRRGFRHGITLGVQQPAVHRDRLIHKSKVHIDDAVLIRIGRNRLQKVITDPLLRTQQQVHIPENPTHTEFILILQITSITPFHHQYRQCVGPLPQIFGHIELTGRMGNLAVSDESAVDPHIKAGIHTLKIQICVRSLRIAVILKRADIRTAGIVLGNIRRVHRKRIIHIGVLMTVISMILPYTRHRDLIESAGAESVFVKRLLQIINTLIIVEFPLTVQQYKTIGSHTLFSDGVHRNRRRNIIRAVWHRIQVKNTQIFIISWH